MASEDDNQEPSTATIIHKTSSVAEPDKHHETVLKHYEAENVKEPIEGDNIDKVPSVGKASSEKLLSSSSEPNSVVEICDKPEVAEILDGEETENKVSKSLGVKEKEGQLPKISDGKETDGHFVEKSELMTEETVGEVYRGNNGGTYQVAEVNESELKEENKVENLSSASTTLDSTEKTTSSDHISRTSPQEGSSHTISSATAEKSAPEDLHSNLEEMESREDVKEEMTNNEKICSDAPVRATLKSDDLSELNKEEAEKGEEMNGCSDTPLAAAPIEETCVTGFRSEADVSSSDIKETVSLVGQNETVEKERHTEISLPEAPRESQKDETEKQPIDEKKVIAVDLNEGDGNHLYSKGQYDAPPLVHETEASEGTQLAVEEPKVMHSTDEADRKLESSDLGMPQTEGASGMDLAPPCQIDADNLETESRLINNDLCEEDEIHLYDTAKGQQDTPPVVHEAKVSEGTQLSVEEPKVMHSIDESDRKLNCSDLGMPLTEGEPDLDLAPACQVNDDNIETESRLKPNHLNKEDEIHPYDMAKGQPDATPPFPETDASEETQLSVEDLKVPYKIDESDRKLDSSDLGMPLNAGASVIDLAPVAPPCQIDADNVETESRLIEKDLNEKAEIHQYDTINGQQDSPSLVHETEASEETQVSVEEPKIMHNVDVSDQKLDSNVIELPLTEGESGIDLAPPCQMDADNLETESRLIENDLNEEAAIHPYDTTNGQQDSPSLVHETETSKETQLSVEEPKVMHNIDVSDRELDSSDIRLPLPKVHDTEGSEGTQLSVDEPNIVHHIDEADGKLDSSVPGLSQTEGAPDINLAPPCQIDAENIETGLNMDSRKELEIIETNTEEKLEEVADSLVESHNSSIANDTNRKVTKEEIEFDNSDPTLPDEKRDEQKVHRSEPTKAPQKSQATDQRDGTQSGINDNINQNSKPEEHEETDTKEKEAEASNSPITDKEHTTSSYSATTEGSKVLNKTTSIAEPDEQPELSNTESTDIGNIDEFPSVDKALNEKLLSSPSELSKASETENGTEQISESLEGKEIQGPHVEHVNKQETEGHASETSDWKETEGCGSKSSDGKETPDYHVEKGEYNSTQEMHTEEILGEGHKGPNGGIKQEETDGDNTEKIIGVGSVKFEDQLSKPSIEEDSSHTISSSVTKKELYIPSVSEDIIVNVEDTESGAMEEDIISNEKNALDAPVNVALKSDHLGSPLSLPPVTPIEEASFTSLGSEADVEGFVMKGITSLDGQNEIEEKGINTKINLPDVPTEARKDENLDTSSSQENQSFDDKSISADDLKEEDGTNQYDSPKGQPVASSLIHETEVCEENQISAEEPEEMHNINEENTMPHSSNRGLTLTPIEGASDMHMIPDSQIDADKAESEIDSPQELHSNPESNTKDKLQQNDADSETIKEETHFHSSSTMPTAGITDETNIKESEYREDSQMERKSEAKEDLGDGKQGYTNENNQNSELQGHGETDISNKEDEEIAHISDKEQIIQIYPEKTTVEESKKTNEEAASEFENIKVNSPNKEEGTEDEIAESVKEKDLLDGLATPEEVIKASVEEDEENGTKIKEVHCDQVITSTKNSSDEDKLEKSYGGDEGKEENVVISQASKIDESSKEISSISESDVKEDGDGTYLAEQASRTDASCEELPTISTTDTEEHSGNSYLETQVTNENVKRREDQGVKSDDPQIDKGTCENVEVMHENFTNESSQVPEYIEKNDHIIQTPKDTEEEGTLNELHSVSQVDIPSHEVEEVGLASQQGIDTTDSNNKAEEIPVPVAENSKTEEDPSITEAQEQMKERKEQVEDMKITLLQNVEEKDSDEKTEGRVLQLAENSNTEPDSSATEVAQGDKEPVQETSNLSLQNIDTMDTDEKSEDRILELATNSITEQESSTPEVPKETKGDKMHIQDMTNMIIEKSEEASSQNFMKEADDCNDKADALVKKESSLEDAHNDEKTFHVDSTDRDNKNPLRISNSCEKVDEVEIEQLDGTSGSVYQTESEIKEIISERIEMETTNEQEHIKDEGQQNREGIEDISGIIHGNNDDVEGGHITSSQNKPEATNELQETCGVQHREEQELETLDSIKETTHEGDIAVGVSRMTSSEEESLLNNDSDPPELNKASVEGMHDQSKLEEDNIYKENSEDTGAEMSSPNPNFLASESSRKAVDNVYVSNVTVITDELQGSKEAADLKSDMSPGVLESEAKLHHADIPNETIEGGIKEGDLLTEMGADNISKEEIAETGSIEDHISREKVNDEGASILEREAIPEEPQSITIGEMSETTKKEDNNEKVSSNDINIIQSEKDGGDDGYEKTFKSNSGGENRSIPGDIPVTDTPGSNEVRENPELLAEGHKHAEGSSIETSEEDRRNIIHDETYENYEDQVIFATNTRDIKVNEVTEQHGITEGDHSKIQDPSLEKLEKDCIATKEVQILDNPLPPLPEDSITNVPKDIEVMPESVKTTPQSETQKHQTADDSNAVAEATNLDSELYCTSDESKTIEQESTTIRPVNEPTLVLAQGPENNNLSDADKGESLAQISEVHDDHVIKDGAEKEDQLDLESRNNENNEIRSTSNLAVSSDEDLEEKDPGESKPMISSKEKDIPLLESGSSTVTGLEEVKHVYSSEAVPEPNNTGIAPDSPTASELRQGFEENVHEPGDTDSREPHEGSHVTQHVDESSMRLQEGSKDVVEITHQTAEPTLASGLTSESLSTPEVGSLIVSSPKDFKDVSPMQEEIAAERNRITDEPEEITTKFLPAETSEESTWEQADHPAETDKLKPGGGEKKPDNTEVEKEEHSAQKEGSSGSDEVVFVGKYDPAEVSKVKKEEHAEQKEGNSGSKVVFIGEKDPDEDAKVEKKEHGEQKEGNSGSEVVFMDEKDPDEDSKVENEEHGEQKECNSGSEVVFIGEKDLDVDAKAEKEEHGEQKRGNSGSEVVLISQKDPDEDAKVKKEEHGEQKEGNSGSEVVFMDKKDPDEDSKVENEEHSDQKERNIESEVVFIGEKDLDVDSKVEKEEHGEQKRGNSGSEVVLISEKDPDEDVKVEKDEHGEQKEGNSGSEVVFMDEKDPDEDKVENEEHSEQKGCNSESEVVLIGKKDLDEDSKVEKEEHAEQKEGNSGSEVVFIGEDAKVEKEEHGKLKDGNSGSEVVFIGEKDQDENIKVEKEEPREQKRGNSGSEVVLISEKDPDEDPVEKEEHGEQKELNSGSEVVSMGDKDPDNTNKIIAAEMKDVSSTIVSDDMILVQADREEGTETLTNKDGTETLTNKDGTEVIADQATVEEKEHDVQKENKSGSEEPINGEKDPDYESSNKIITSGMDSSSNMAMSEMILSGHSEDHMEGVVSSKDKEVKSNETKAEREEQDVQKGKEPVSEALPTSEKDVDGHPIDSSIIEEMKYGASSATPDDRILVQECPEDHIEKKNYSDDQEKNTDQEEAVEEQGMPKEGKPEAEVPLTIEKDNEHHTSNRTPIVEMEDESLSAEPDYGTLVQEGPGALTKDVIFSRDKEVRADVGEVATRDQDGIKQDKLGSEVAVMSEKYCVDNKVLVKESSEDLRETATHSEDKGVKPDSKSGITDAEIEKPIPVNTSEAVAESETFESAEEKIYSHDYQGMQEAMKSTLSPKSSQYNQGEDSAEETKLNDEKIESPHPENVHALPHTTDLSTETITKADDNDVYINSKNTDKQEVPPLEAEKYMVVEADLKVTQEPEDANNILQLQQKEAAETIQLDDKSARHGEQGPEPANSNNDKTTTNETKEGNNLPSEKETPVVEHFNNEHFSEANKEEVHAKSTAKKEDSKAVTSTEHKDKEHEEGKEHHDENTDFDHPVMIEASRDHEVKVTPKKSHNLLSGVIKHSISKMKKAITCTNAQPMPQSPR